VGAPVVASVNETVSGAGPDVVSAEKSTVIPAAPVMRKRRPIILVNRKKTGRMHIHKYLLSGNNRQLPGSKNFPEPGLFLIFF